MYEIMMGDKKVAEYSKKLTILDKKRVPLFLKNMGNFEQWVSERAIDSSRTNSRHLKRANGLSPHASDFETAMFVHAACVTDNFWVKEDFENLTWIDVKHDSDIFFNMAISSDDSGLKPSKNPELTNIGSQEKGWKLVNGEWWLCKNEKSEEEEFELLTYKIGLLMGFDMAEYQIKDGYIYTKDFTEGKYNLQHADSFLFDHIEKNKKVFDDDERYNYDTFKKMGFSKQYLDIICLDAIVNNTDRHTKNYGVLTSQEDGSIVKLAPNYDNNQSFYDFNRCTERNNGLLKYFNRFIEDNRIDYEVPYLSKEDVEKLCNETVTNYIMEGYNAVCANVKEIHEDIVAHSDSVWVRPHPRRGFSVRGHWRKRRARKNK